ncbi:MAG: DUF2225 domain-containing protein [Spirochaetes bacterium]|nr:DUF2225 domain-containing protein [Spirochaetota bacterium]
MLKISFFSKEDILCPICEEKFKRENMLTGGGRLNAGELTDELRRIYNPTKKFGKINPLIYPITVCPKCFFAAYSQDFDDFPQKNRDLLINDTKKRIDFIKEIFDDIDFRKERTIKEGIASYILTIYSYAFFPQSFSPSTKKALSALRCSWLLNDLYEETKDEKYSALLNIMYKKAYLLFQEAYEKVEKGKEAFDRIKFGPDLDKDFGFNGFLYIYVYLFLKFGLDQIKDIEEKIKTIDKMKIIISKVFGMGKSSKEKTVFLLDKSRAMYDRLNEIQKELQNK